MSPAVEILPLSDSLTAAPSTIPMPSTTIPDIEPNKFGETINSAWSAVLGTTRAAVSAVSDYGQSLYDNTRSYLTSNARPDWAQSAVKYAQENQGMLIGASVLAGGGLLWAFSREASSETSKRSRSYRSDRRRRRGGEKASLDSTRERSSRRCSDLASSDPHTSSFSARQPSSLALSEEDRHLIQAWLATRQHVDPEIREYRQLVDLLKDLNELATQSRDGLQESVDASQKARSDLEEVTALANDVATKAEFGMEALYKHMTGDPDWIARFGAESESGSSSGPSRK